MLTSIDITVMALYLAVVVALGCWFAKRSANTTAFMTAKGAIPTWAVGLSIFGTYLSSNTFLGVPGKAYASNWNAFVFSLSLPLSAWIATRFFVPFYRRSGQISAYEHLESRFGPWARTYAVACYLLTQFARTGIILFGVSLALTALTGWDQASIIVVAGILVTLYTVLGGIEAVIWTDAIQSIILVLGAIIMLVLLLINLPAGPQQVFSIGSAHEKFSLGSFDLDFTSSTFWVVLLFGLFVNLSNFGIDQSFVQRYHTAQSERQAGNSVWLAALLYLPVSLLFFFIGTSSYAFYQTHPEQLAEVSRSTAKAMLVEENQPITQASVSSRATQLTDADLGDKVLPHFIVNGLPVGVRGLLVAAIFAAAMSSIDSSLNSSATVILTDIYQRFVRPSVAERESMVVLYCSTILMGAIGTTAAVAMIGIQSVLDTWWLLSGIFAGGLLGLFLLGMINDRAGNFVAKLAVAVGLGTIAWMSWSKLSSLLLPIETTAVKMTVESATGLLPSLHENMTIVIGTSTILIVGLVLACFFPSTTQSGSLPAGQAE